MSSIVEYKKCSTEVRTICVAVYNFALVNNMLFAIAPHVIVQHSNKINVANTVEWLGSAGKMNEFSYMPSEGSFMSKDLAYNEAQSAMDCTAPSEVQKSFVGEAAASPPTGGSNGCAFQTIRSRDCAIIE